MLETLLLAFVLASLILVALEARKRKRQHNAERAYFKRFLAEDECRERWM